MISAIWNCIGNFYVTVDAFKFMSVLYDWSCPQMFLRLFTLSTALFLPLSGISQTRRPDERSVLTRAMDLANAGEEEQARLLAEGIRNQNSVDPATMDKLGKVYEKLGDVKAAEESYQRAIRLAPQVEDYYLDLVSLLFLLEKPRTAVKVLKYGLMEIPDSYSLLVALGTATQIVGAKKEAQRIFEQAIAQKSTEVPAFVLLGKLETSMGQTDKAIETLKHAIKLDPKDARARYYLGLAYLAASGNEKEAMGEFLEALNIRPGYALARYEFAKGLEHRDQFAEAINEYNRALRDDPSLIHIQYRLYRCYLRLGQKGKAQESLKLFQRYQATKRPTLPPIPPLGGSSESEKGNRQD